MYNDKVGKDENGMPIHSSMYKSLKTNLPKEVMAFPDFPFPSDETESFLHHTQGNLLTGVLSSGQVQIRGINLGSGPFGNPIFQKVLQN